MMLVEGSVLECGYDWSQIPSTRICRQAGQALPAQLKKKKIENQIPVGMVNDYKSRRCNN
jgi:hypothetical protein